MNKKILVFLIAIIIIVLFITIILILDIKTKDNIKMDNEIFGLTEKLKEYKKDSISILHQYDGCIYGTIETDIKDPMLLTTKATFSYRIDEDKLNIIKEPNNMRVIDFIISNNKIYYCYLKYNEQETFYWSVYVNDIETENTSKIMDGTISNIFEYPRIFAKENNSIFLISKSEETLKLSKINDEEIEHIKIIEDENINMFNMDSIIYMDKKIYYTSTGKDRRDSIKTIDIETGEEEIIYKSNSEKEIIYTFNIVENKTILQEVENEDNANLITVNNKSKKIIQNIETKLLTFPRIINENNILFHSTGNMWQKYDISENKIQTLEDGIFKNDSIFPKYIVIGENKLLLQSFSNVFYVVTL